MPSNTVKNQGLVPVASFQAACRTQEEPLTL